MAPWFGQHVPFLKWHLAVFCLRSGAPCRQVVKVPLIGHLAITSLMRSGLGVERQVARQALVRGPDSLIGV